MRPLLQLLGNGNETIITALGEWEWDHYYSSFMYLSAHGGSQPIVECHNSIPSHHLHRHAIEPHLCLLLCLEEDLEERERSS